MTAGGARPGAGRPRKREKYAGQITRAEKRIADRLPELIDKMMELANGVLIEETNPVTGDPQVYQKPPDRQALEYLVNRIMGKPTERQEHSGSDGDAIRIETRFIDSLNRAYASDDDATE